MIDRFKKAMPLIQELIADLEWIENEYSPKNATEAITSKVPPTLIL